MSRERYVGLIPARGGSKRLPRKNIAPFLGRPMLMWTVEAATSAGIFDRIVVSTEDAEIADLALSAGVEVDHRREDLATDNASVVDVCLEFLACEEARGTTYDVLCCLYPTAPMRDKDDVLETMRLVCSRRFDYAIAMTHFALPPHQAMKMEEEQRVTPMWPDLVKKRSEDIGQLVVDNGSTYAARVAAFKKERSFYSPNCGSYIMPRRRSVDIDLPEDLVIAELFARHLNSGNVN